MNCSGGCVQPGLDQSGVSASVGKRGVWYTAGFVDGPGLGDRQTGGVRYTAGFVDVQGFG